MPCDVIKNKNMEYYESLWLERSLQEHYDKLHAMLHVLKICQELAQMHGTILHWIMNIWADFLGLKKNS